MDSERSDGRKKSEYHFPLSFKDIETGNAPDELCKLIMDCSQKVDSENLSHATVYNSFLFTALAEGVVTPFSRFVGPHKNKAIIISRHVDSITPFDINQHKLVTLGYPLKQSKHYLNHSDTLPSKTTKKVVAIDTNAGPLPLQVARYLCSCFIIWCRKNSTSIKSIPDLWILVDGTSRHIVALGCSIDITTSTKPSFVCYDVRQGESTLSIPEKKLFSIKCSSLLPKQRQKTGITGFDSSQLTSQYEFGPCMEDGEAGTAASQMSLDFIWDGGRDNIFTAPPSTSAEVVLNIQSTPGYIYSPVANIYREIQYLLQLSKIASSLANWSSLAAVDSEDVLSVSNGRPSLLSQIQSFLEDVNTPVEPTDVSILSPSIQCSQFRPREDLDFLDKLWLFLKYVANPNDLQSALGQVFKSVLLRHVQPYIHKSKSSQLAKLFRQSLLVTSNDEHQVIATKLQALLSEEKAVQCVVEIGIEKMQLDYVSHFVTLSNLVMGSDVKSYFQSDDTLLNRVYKLCSLHCVLELTADMITFLSLPTNTVTSFIKKALDYYRHVRVETFETTPVFRLPFSTVSSELKYFASFASSLIPVAMSSHVAVGDVQKVICCTNEPLFKYLHTSGDISITDNDTNRMYVYYVTSSTII